MLNRNWTVILGALLVRIAHVRRQPRHEPELLRAWASLRLPSLGPRHAPHGTPIGSICTGP